MTLPVLPFSLPEMTITSSLLRIFISGSSDEPARVQARGGSSEGPLEHLRREGHDAHEAAVAQLARHGAEDARAARVVRRVEDHRGVLVEGDVGAVVAPELLLRAHDDRLDDLALLDRALRVRLLDGRRDDVAHARVAAAGAAHHADAEDLAGARVVGDLEACLVLDHFALWSTSVRRQRLVRDIGRHSTTRTVSPAPASLRSSWTCSFVEVRMIFP